MQDRESAGSGEKSARLDAPRADDGEKSVDADPSSDRIVPSRLDSGDRKRFAWRRRQHEWRKKRQRRHFKRQR